MHAVRGCDLPDGLLYHVEHNVWVRRDDRGLVTVGFTAYACALAGPIVAYTPKSPGRIVARNKSCATIESGKWVGPVKTPVGGEVLEVNQLALRQPGIINQDSYGAGWLARLRPMDWDGEAAELLMGPEARAAFEAKMEAEGFEGCTEAP